MAVGSVVRVSIGDVREVRDAFDNAAATIATLQEALIAERIGWRIGPGLLGMGSPEFAAL